TLELGLGALLLIVFVGALVARGDDRRALAWLATLGVLALGVLSAFAHPVGPALGGMFVQDGLALFAKRLFLTATFIGLLAGLSFVYGATGTTDLAKVAAAAAGGGPLLTLGLVATLVGFAFKIAAFPFHMWVPDTYEAASTPFVAWLSVTPKAAGFVAIFRVYFEGAGDHAAAWVPVAALLATLTMLAGNLMALPQQNTKRLLAYSGIAQ